MREESATCFHCQQEILGKIPFITCINGHEQPMCCSGCRAVAEMISQTGLLNYYKYRTEAARRPDFMQEEQIPDSLRESLEFYDHPEVARQFVTVKETGQEVNLIIDNIVCAACVWLLEHRVLALDGVLKFQVNYTTHRAYLVFDPQKIRLSEIFIEILHLGYEATPYDMQVQQQKLAQEKRSLLMSFGIAALSSMQVMTCSFALYFGHYEGMHDFSRLVLRWMSLIMAIPCFTYSSTSFYKAAYYDIRNRRLSMNVNVSLAIILATGASIWNTLVNTGEIYFESVTMFAFLLLGARLIEMSSRHKALLISDHILKLKPYMAERVLPDNQMELIAVNQIRSGDLLKVKPGDSIPADGRLVSTMALVDESLLTGESLPVEKLEGDRLIGGSINHEQALFMEVTEIGAETVLTRMSMMIERAMGEKPQFVKRADTVSTWFVLLLLVACVATYGVWLVIDSAQAFPVMLAVLVVSCPCALALATPSALSAGNQTMIAHGLIGTRPNTLERLSQITDIVFDKTGTLTEGVLMITQMHTMTHEYNQEELLQIACSLESYSSHPIALGFKKEEVRQKITLLPVAHCQQLSGRGLSGMIAGQVYKIGRLDWFDIDIAALKLDHGMWLALGSEREILALYCLQDGLKEDACAVARQLQQAGYTLHILSGDRQETVTHFNQTLAIEYAYGNQTPEDKLAYVAALQNEGKVVAMLGDGINDAPVLAKADISLAIGQGALLAKTTADMILMRSHQLMPLIDGIRIARKTNKIVIENLVWALLYNVVALPVAMLGFLLPWMAALGMSMSSLLVIGNTLRIREPE